MLSSTYGRTPRIPSPKNENPQVAQENRFLQSIGHCHILCFRRRQSDTPLEKSESTHTFANPHQPPHPSEILQSPNQSLNDLHVHHKMHELRQRFLSPEGLVVSIIPTAVSLNPPEIMLTLTLTLNTALVFAAPGGRAKCQGGTAPTKSGRQAG